MLNQKNNTRKNLGKRKKQLFSSFSDAHVVMLLHPLAAFVFHHTANFFFCSVSCHSAVASSSKKNQTMEAFASLLSNRFLYLYEQEHASISPFSTPQTINYTFLFLLFLYGISVDTKLTSSSVDYASSTSVKNRILAMYYASLTVLC